MDEIRRFEIGIVQPPYPSAKAGVTSTEAVEFMVRAIRECRQRLDLIVLPEYATSPGAESLECLRALLAGNFPDRMAGLAAEKKTHLAVNGVATRDGRNCNTTILFDRTGREVARYEKTHLTVTELQTFKLLPGPGEVAVEMEEIRFSFLTCFEIYFPEYVERVASLTPDVVIFPSYQRSEESEVIRKQVMGRALDLEAFIVRASYSLGDESPTGGCSMVVDPHGRILLDAGQRTGLFSCSIQPKEKRLRPLAYGLGIRTSRSIVEEFRKPELYRPAGPGAV